MGPDEFLRQLKELGFEPTMHEGNRATFPFVIPIGRFAGKAIRLGLVIGSDFPLTCPSGPHISPSMLPIHPSNDVPHPAGGIHESDFTAVVGGDTWQYWSRPFNGWGGSAKTVRVYMAHLNNLFDSQ
jgi:hypothetical protein